MADNKNNYEQEQVEHENRLSFEPKVLEKIANYSVSNVDGILELKGNWSNSVRDFFSSNSTTGETAGVSAEVGEEEVALDLEVIGEYGKDLRQAFDQVVEVTTDAVRRMTGLKVVEVNMNVSNIMTRNEYDHQQNEKDREEREKRRQEQEEIDRENRQGQYSDGSRVQ